MNPDNTQNRRPDARDAQPVPNGTDRLPPYAGQGNEPSDQVAEDWITDADHPGERAVSDITSDEIAAPDSTPRPIAGRADRLTDPWKPVDAAFPDPEAHIHNAIDEERAGKGAPVETFTEKDGGTPLPGSIPGDPVSPGVGPLSRGLVAIIVLVLLLILIAVIVSLL